MVADEKTIGARQFSSRRKSSPHVPRIMVLEISLASPRRERQGSFNPLGEINIGVRSSPIAWTAAITFDGLHFRCRSFPRDRTDVHAIKLRGAIAIHELMTRLLYLNGRSAGRFEPTSDKNSSKS